MFTYGVDFIGSKPAAAISYFREGMSIAGLLEKVAAWRFGGWDGVGSVLDFAAGYGRSTRFLVEHLPPERVTVAEIQPEALEFQRGELGVKTLLSTTDPEELDTSATFDLVFVASLFTHLPGHTFGKWLAKLWTLVAPGGVLVFSVHDEAINRAGVPLEDGFAFIPRSEVASLSVEEYGTTFTTAEYVRRRLRVAIGTEADDALRLPRALCFEQDVWVVPRGHPPAEALEYECGPIAVLDRFDVRGRTLEASGWAADRGAAVIGAPTHDVPDLAVFVNGAPMTGLEIHRGTRPDVAQFLGAPDDPRFLRSGWTAHGKLHRRLRTDDVVSITATCEHGASFVMESSRVDDLWGGCRCPRTPRAWFATSSALATSSAREACAPSRLACRWSSGGMWVLSCAALLRMACGVI
ncbi:MAG: class I SAM-dependent methyltransferase [Solirubrobacteraceae bacterium]